MPVGRLGAAGFSQLNAFCMMVFCLQAVMSLTILAVVPGALVRRGWDRVM